MVNDSLNEPQSLECTLPTLFSRTIIKRAISRIHCASWRNIHNLPKKYSDKSYSTPHSRQSSRNKPDYSLSPSMDIACAKWKTLQPS